MLHFLSQIACVLLQIPCYILYALVAGFNFLIAAIGALIALAVALLPGMPELPALPGPMATALGWVAWVFPVNTLVAIFSFVLVVWLAWQLVALAMRWAKATSE